MKKYLLVVMLIGCLALLAGCITVVIPTEKPAPTQLPPQPTATHVPSTPTSAPTATPKPIPPSATPAPSITTLQSAVVGFPPQGFVLYYDPAKWTAKLNESNASVWNLESKGFNGCILKQLLGHGVNPDQTPLTTEMLNYNGIEITYNVWRDKDTHFPAIVGYYWNNSNSSLEVFAKDSPEDCLKAAQQVVKDSAGYGFTN
jgi:hypothetical protein